MATRLGHIDLVSRLSQGSHLFIPPLTFDRAAVLSATHLASLIRSSGRDAQVLAHPSWIQHLMMEADADLFLLPDEYAYHLQERPETTWLWGLSSPRQHSQELRNFMLGLSTVQVLDWTGESRRPIGDAVHHTPFLGGLTELSYSLSRELWPVHNWDDHYLGEGLASFMERYPLLTRDAPLIHLFGQLTLPHRPEEPLPKLSELLREDDWALYCYRGLNPNQAALIERILFDLFVSDPANHIIILIEREEGKFSILSIHSEVEDDLKARSWIRSKVEQAANGSDFIVDEPKKLLEKLIEALQEIDVSEPESSEPNEDSEEEEIEAPEGVEASVEEDIAPTEEEDSPPEDAVLSKRKAPKLRLDPWPFSLYLGNHFSFGCTDPQWSVERDQRLEAAREIEPDEPTIEEEEEERRLLEWDSMQLLRRIQALKRPPIRLRWQDLKAAHLPIIDLSEKDLKSTFDTELESWEQEQAVRMKALLEEQAKEALKRAEEEALRELEEKTRQEDEEKARIEAEEKAAEEEMARIEAEEKAAEEEMARIEAEEKAAEEERARIEAEEEENKTSESDAIPDILHQQGEGWSSSEDEEEDDDASLLRAFDQLEENQTSNEDEWDDEKGINDSEGIEHPSLDMFMEEEEEDPEAILAKLEEQEEAFSDEEEELEDTKFEDEPDETESVNAVSEEAIASKEEEQSTDFQSSAPEDILKELEELDSQEHTDSTDTINQNSETENQSSSEEFIAAEPVESDVIEGQPPESSSEELAQEGQQEFPEVEEATDESETENVEPSDADAPKVESHEASEDEAAQVEDATDESETENVEPSDADAPKVEAHDVTEDETAQADEATDESATESLDPSDADAPEVEAHEATEDGIAEIEEETEGAFNEPTLSSEEILDRLEETFEIEEDLPSEDIAPAEEAPQSATQDPEESAIIVNENASEPDEVAPEPPLTDSDSHTTTVDSNPREDSFSFADENEAVDLAEEETIEASMHDDDISPSASPSPSESGRDNSEDNIPPASPAAEVEEENQEEAPKTAPSPSPPVTLGRRGPTGYLNPYLWDHRNTLQDVFDEVRQSSVLRASDWPYLAMLIIIGLFAWIHNLPMI